MGLGLRRGALRSVGSELQGDLTDRSDRPDLEAAARNLPEVKSSSAGLSVAPIPSKEIGMVVWFVREASYKSPLRGPSNC